MDVRKERKQKQYVPKRKKHSKTVYGQESQKIQQKREVVEEKSGELSRC